MRAEIIAELHNLMQADENIFVLTNDLTYGNLDSIKADFPTRFFNVGVAEQDMIGISAGLALSGKRVFCYSIIPFLTLRCYEQIRNDLCYHNLNVVLIGAGAGLSYGTQGNTHFALEDIAIMRVLPNISIISPADKIEGALAMKYLQNHKGPVYFRTGKRNEETIYDQPYDFQFGKGVITDQGSNIAVFTSGPIISQVAKANQLLESSKGFKATIINIHTIKPIDHELITKIANDNDKLFVVEEHYTTGGLGSAILEVLAKNNISKPTTLIGLDDKFILDVGSQQYLRKINLLDAQGIFKRISAVL